MAKGLLARAILGGVPWGGWNGPVGLGCAGEGGFGICACVFCGCGSAGGLRAGLVVLGIGFRLAVCSCRVACSFRGGSALYVCLDPYIFRASLAKCLSVRLRSE